MENLLEDRRKEISDGLEAASKSQRKLEEANKESAVILDGAKAEASSLINQANSRADQIVDEAKDQAVEEAKKIKLSAEADIEQSANKAKDGLRDEVAALVIAGAQKILDKEINAKANKDIIDSLIKKI
jgi:F-type H+-transporting ATPase subunit b